MRAASEWQAGTDLVVCVDGIFSATWRSMTPDISWQWYVSHLRQRRPDLNVLHLSQPADMVEILLGQSANYSSYMRSLCRTVLRNISPEIRNVVIIGFSFGGIVALDVITELSKLVPQAAPEYLCLVTIGSSFAGTTRPQDIVLSRSEVDYLQRMFDTERTRSQMEQLAHFSERGRSRILVGRIARDEIVGPDSQRRALEWLEGINVAGDFRFGEFKVNPDNLVRPHDGFLYDLVGTSFVDGLVDGLLPRPWAEAYEPQMPLQPRGGWLAAIRRDDRISSR
ncbi:hypothetical protein KDL29_12090 [bacterium]|nr:hypothetical protein [bacterium]